MAGIALNRQRRTHSKACRVQQSTIKCPKRTIWKVCRIKAASTAVRRACRNLSPSRRTVLIRASCAITKDSRRRKLRPAHGNGPTESSGFRSGRCRRAADVSARRSKQHQALADWSVRLADGVVRWHNFNLRRDQFPGMPLKYSKLAVLRPDGHLLRQFLAGLN